MRSALVAQAAGPPYFVQCSRGLPGMCRNIKTLFNFDPPVTDEEVRAASLQFVRKISGYNKPSKANQEAFDRAVREIAEASDRLLAAIQATGRSQSTAAST